MTIKSFDSDLEAIDYCCNIPWEVVYSSESHRFYSSGYNAETGEIEGFYRVCRSPFGSSEFYSEANRFYNSLEVYLDA